MMMATGLPATCKAMYTFEYSDYGNSHVAFDAQCDLAAVVYGADDDPDRLISTSPMIWAVQDVVWLVWSRWAAVANRKIHSSVS